jgi:3-oxoacyl-[acyl-carrier-protein] synthase II
VGVEKNWEALMAGRSGIGPITHFDPSRLKVRIAGEARDFQAEDFLDRKEIRRMDRFEHLAIAASDLALKDAGLTIDPTHADRVAVIIGTQFGGLASFEESHRKALEHGPERVSPFFVLQTLMNMAAGYVSIRHGIRGPSFSTSSACSSSAHAIGEGMRYIQRGECDVALVGGAEAPVTLLGVAGFASMGALSTRNDAPQAASRPFDRDRDGFVLAEGAALLVLESERSAQRRSARVLAELAGYGATSDAHHVTAPMPRHDGARRAMQLALSEAALSPRQVGYLNAHGTSTPLGDILEAQAVADLFGAHAADLAVSSTKSMTGHLNGAAGAAEAAITVLTLTRGVLPPTVNLDHQDPEIALDCVPHRAREKRLTAVMSNSFGFGGTNVTLLFRKAEA